MGRKLSGSKLANLVIIIAIVSIPLMYAGLLTWAYEAPLTRVNNLKAAVVNLDHSAQATVNQQSKTLHLGADLEKELYAKDAPGFAWVKADLTEAQRGLASGKYRATLIIPENFSSNFAILANPENTPPRPSIIDLQTDDAVNYLAGSMAISVAKGLETILSQNGAKAYINQALLSFRDIKSGLMEGASGAERLTQGLEQLQNGNASAAQGSSQLATGLTRLSGGVAALQGGIHRLNSGAQALVVGMDSLLAGSVKISDKAVDIQEGAQALTLGTQRLDQALKDYTSGAERLGAGVQELSASLQDSSPEPNLKNGSATLSQGLAKLNTAAQSTSGAFQALEQGWGQLEEGMQQAGAASTQLAQGAQALETSLQAGANQTSLKDGSAALLNFTQKLRSLCQQMANDPACQALTAELGASGWDGLVSSAQKLDSGIEQAHTGAKQISQGATGLAQTLTQKQSPQTLAGGLTRLKTALLGTDPAAPSLKVGVNALAQGLAQAQQGAERLDQGISAAGAGSQQLQQGFTQLLQHTPVLLQGVDQLAQGSSQFSSALPQATAGLASLATGSQQLAKGSKDLAQGLTQAQQGSQDLARGTSSALQGAQALDQGNQQLAAGSSQARAGAKELAAKLSEGSKKLPQLSKAQSEKVAQAAAAPVQVNHQREHAVYENGIGFAPFFMGLGLWIGGIALFLIFPALDLRRSPKEPFYICSLRSLGTALIFGAVQALVVVSGLQLFLNLNAVYLLSLYGICLLSSFCFVSINQACVATLGFRGRFVSVLLLCLQLTTAGATFPIETAPKFLQLFHAFLPMTYTVDAARSLIAGGELSLVTPILVLALWMVAAWGLSFYASARRHGLKPMPFDPALAFPGNSPRELVL